jgi:hypothetical protein
MSEELNKEIREFFINIGEDIKKAFDECYSCNCFNRVAPVHAQIVGDIEHYVTQDMNNVNNPQVTIDIDNDVLNNDVTDNDVLDLDVEELNSDKNVIVKKKYVIYYDCYGDCNNDYKSNYWDESETKNEHETDNDGDGGENIEDDYVIIY